MHDRRLRIYLDDHLALMAAEAALAKRCRRSNRSGPLGSFLGQLAVEVDAQRSIARDVLRRLGGAESRVKQTTAWFTEKLGRLKPNDAWVTYSPLSRVVELETLAAAAKERASLWDTLEAIAGADERLGGITFSFFRDEAGRHADELDTRRRYAAVEAFTDE